MPQMSPLSWLSLFIIFFITFLIFNVMNYFCQTPLINKQKKSMKVFNFSSMNWKW